MKIQDPLSGRESLDDVGVGFVALRHDDQVGAEQRVLQVVYDVTSQVGKSPRQVLAVGANEAME